MKRIFLLALMLFVLLPLTMLAQVPNMMSMARGELQKRGLNENEVRARLLEEGIDVDNIPPAEYPNFQGRVTEVINKMVAEKNAADKTPAQAATGGEIVVTEMKDAPQTTTGEQAAEDALEEALKENHVSPDAGDHIYGHSIFTGRNLNVYRTTDGAQAPDTYVLGEGDEVHISIFGSSQTEIHQRVLADGSINPAGTSKIFLKGMTLAQARTAIINKLSQHFSFRKDQIAVTITTARTVNVSIYGEVGVQGAFTLSALNSVFNALCAAGGPTAIGSVRNIQLSRAGKTTRLDIYEYMRNPGTGVNYGIQNGDVLFVPVAQKLVTIKGAVNRPMVYEMIDGETLTDLIDYAGGITKKAYPEYAQIERFLDGQLNYFDYNLSDVLEGKLVVTLQAGDVVTVKSAHEPVENYVTITGDVYYKDRFEYDKNTSLKALLEHAKPRYTARKDYVFVERQRPDETIEVLTVPYPGENGNPDFRLEPRDKVTVWRQSTYRDVETIEVSGQVRNPFSRHFSLDDKLTVSQAIEYAGGLKPTVFPVAYIFRKDITNPEIRHYISVDLNKDGDKLLMPGDRLNVYDNTTYTDIGEVRVSGAVRNAMGVPYDATLTVHDLLTMAGGFTKDAAYDHVELFRVNISLSEVDLDMITLQLDEDFNVVEPVDFQLQPYDHLVVRMIPNFTMGRTVEVNGRVKYPGSYVIDDEKTQLWEIIQRAGGLLSDADPHSRLTRTKGRNVGSIGLNLKEVKRHRGNIKSDPIVMDGDVINVMRLENTVTIRETGTRMAQYVPEEFSAAKKVIVYQGRHDADWYIKHYAGGYTKTADRNSVTVTMANNQSESTRRFLFFRRYPKVEPGSVITLRIDQEKKQELEKPREKVDWDYEISRALGTLTSVVSIVMMVKAMNSYNN